MAKFYPGGKKKAFNITYDDGVLQDERFVALLNRYGIKGTFNLNSADFSAATSGNSTFGAATIGSLNMEHVNLSNITGDLKMFQDSSLLQSLTFYQCNYFLN